MIAPVDAGRASAATVPRQGPPPPPAASGVTRRGQLRRWLPLAVVALPTIAAVHHYGVGWRPLGAFCAYLVAGLAIPGTLVWRAVRRRSASPGSSARSAPHEPRPSSPQVGGRRRSAAVEKVGQPALAAVRDGFAPVDGPPLLMPRGARVAGRWLRDHSDPDQLVAINAHCREPGCNLHFWFAAFAERRFLVEGWGVTDRANGWRQDGRPLPRKASFWDPAKLADNDAVFRTPSAPNVDRLRRTYGVRRLLVDETRPGTSPELGRFASLRFRAGSCAVYEL